jgi:hypothetical protein
VVAVSIDAARDITHLVYCKSSEHFVATTRLDLEYFNGAGRLTKRTLTGLVRAFGDPYIPGEFIVDECKGCASSVRVDPVRIGLAKIREHVDEIEARGVAQDDAIRAAVERQMTMSEIKLSPAFVAEVHGIDPVEVGLEDAIVAVKVDGCIATECDREPTVVCSECGARLCVTHSVHVSYGTSMSGSAISRVFCKACKP